MDSGLEKLEARLRMTDPEIADDGFSEGVLARLPARRLPARTARCLSYALAGAIGSVLTSIGLLPEIFPSEIFPVIVSEYGAMVTPLLTSLAVIGLLLVPLAWLIYGELTDRSTQ